MHTLVTLMILTFFSFLGLRRPIFLLPFLLHLRHETSTFRFSFLVPLVHPSLTAHTITYTPKFLLHARALTNDRDIIQHL